jgi:Sulfotransferase domain
MTVRVVGAGLGRTGTKSLHDALELLLGGRCYHMMEVFGRPDDVPVWTEAFEGGHPDWLAFFEEFTAVVDWPAAGRWEEISAAHPDAVILLSTRSSADAWWESASKTIFEVMDHGPPEDDGWTEMATAMITSFCPEWREADSARRAYEEHNAHVRAAADPARLVEWQPGDGWDPICAALGVAVPSELFPHTNTTAEFRAMAGLDNSA